MGIAAAGVFLLIPLMAVVFLLFKLYQVIIGPSKLVAAKFGIESPFKVQMLILLTFLLLSFVFGFLVRAKFVANIRDAIEHYILRFLPGYEFMKLRLRNLMGEDKSADDRAILVRIDDGWSPAFMMEPFGKDQYVVYVPDVPKSSTGSVYVVEASQVRFLHIPFNQLDLIIRNFGAGLSEVGAKNPDLLKG